MNEVLACELNKPGDRCLKFLEVACSSLLFLGAN